MPSLNVAPSQGKAPFTKILSPADLAAIVAALAGTGITFDQASQINTLNFFMLPNGSAKAVVTFKP